MDKEERERLIAEIAVAKSIIEDNLQRLFDELEPSISVIRGTHLYNVVVDGVPPDFKLRLGSARWGSSLCNLERGSWWFDVPSDPTLHNGEAMLYVSYGTQIKSFPVDLSSSSR